jgi:hypothetical protein
MCLSNEQTHITRFQDLIIRACLPRGGRSRKRFRKPAHSMRSPRRARADAREAALACAVDIACGRSGKRVKCFLYNFSECVCACGRVRVRAQVHVQVRMQVRAQCGAVAWVRVRRPSGRAPCVRLTTTTSALGLATPLRRGVAARCSSTPPRGPGAPPRRSGQRPDNPQLCSPAAAPRNWHAWGLPALIFFTSTTFTESR